MVLVDLFSVAFFSPHRNLMTDLTYFITTIGFKADTQYLFSADLFKNNPEVIFCVLNNNGITIIGDTPELPEIELSSLRKGITKDYEFFNSNPGTIIEYQLPSKEYYQSSLPIGEQEKNLFKSIVYFPSAEQRETSFRIISKIYHAFSEYILELLPERPIREERTNVI